MNEHYFSTTPTSERRNREVVAHLGGRDVTIATASGVFSPEHLDRGTSVLLDSLEQRGSVCELEPVLDLGCGWGPIALDAALREPDREVWAIDVNERSLDLTRENAARLGLSNVRVSLPEAVPAELSFGELRSNPPIRIGKQALHELLEQWLPRLMTNGRASLVVAKHLGAPSLERWLGERFTWANVSRVGRDLGFHVLEATRESA